MVDQHAVAEASSRLADVFIFSLETLALGPSSVVLVRPVPICLVLSCAVLSCLVFSSSIAVGSVRSFSEFPPVSASVTDVPILVPTDNIVICNDAERSSGYRGWNF